jgi:hypothetical protein
METRILERERGLRAEGRDQRQIVVVERVARELVVDVHDTEDAIANAQRHAEERLRGVLCGVGRRDEVGMLRHVTHEDRLAPRGRLAGDPLTQAHPHVLSDAGRQSRRRCDAQRPPILLEQHDRDDLDAEHLPELIDHLGKELLDLEDGRDAAPDVVQELEARDALGEIPLAGRHAPSSAAEPRSTRTISATMATAISPGVSAPRASPIGARTPARNEDDTPRDSSAWNARATLRLLPMNPTCRGLLRLSASSTAMSVSWQRVMMTQSAEGLSVGRSLA